MIKTNQQGFTLIETLIYIALFSIIIGGVMLSVYGIIEASNANQSKIILQDEGGFLLAKINWAMDGASGISTPTTGGTGATLTVNKYDFSPNPLMFDLSAGKLRLKEGSGGTATNLNSDNAQVTAVNFFHFNSSGAEGITATFTLQTNSASGKSFIQDFSTTKYLRK